MDTDLLVATYPRLYHMAEVGSWPSIKRHGLLSTSALLDLFGITGSTRHAIESVRRGQIVPIAHPVHGEAVIRDQEPLIESRLQVCLVDMTPRQWYELLNGYVFFWLTESRLSSLVNARPYKRLEHDVLTLDTADLVHRYGDSILLSLRTTPGQRPTSLPRVEETRSFRSPSTHTRSGGVSEASD